MRNKWLLVMMIPAFLFVILFLYFPLAKGVVMAFQNYNMFDLTNLHFIGLDNFKAIITDPYTNFWQILWNTLIWLVFSLAFQFLLGFTLALLLKKPFAGRGIYSGLVFYTWALSGFAIGLIWSWLFNGQFGLFNDILIRLSIIDSPLGFLSTPKLAMMSVIITNIWYGVPFFGIMLLAALQSVPNELYEAATIDGSSPWNTFWRITLPLLRSTVLVVLVLATIASFKAYELIVTMTKGGPGYATKFIVQQVYQVAFQEDRMGYASAMSIVLMVIIGIFTLVQFKFAGKDGQYD